MNRRTVFALALAAGPVFSQAADFAVAVPDASEAGATYSSMLSDLSGACSTGSLAIRKIAAPDPKSALQLLNDGVVQASIIAADQLSAAKVDEPYSVVRVETLLALHPEVIHLIGRVGQDSGRRVGSVDADLVTAQSLGERLHLDWTIVPFRSTGELLDALRDRKVDVAMLVASAPSQTVSRLAGDFKLLPLHGDGAALRLYSPATVQYRNLNGNTPVETLSRQALLVTRSWQSDRMRAQMSSLRDCFEQSIPAIQDRPGTNAAWQNVRVNDQGKWPWLELPKPLTTAPWTRLCDGRYLATESACSTRDR